MIKVIALLLVLGVALGIPTPRVDDYDSYPRSDNDFRYTGNVIKEMELSLDELDAIFKKSLKTSGNNKRIGLLPEEHVNQPLHDGDFLPMLRPSPVDDFHDVPARDPYVGSEEAASRAIDSPLFFDTFDHAHMVTSYAERRQAPLLFRSIRPDFPFSDVSNRRKAN